MAVIELVINRTIISCHVPALMIGEGGLRQSLFALPLVIGEGGTLHQLTNWCVGEGGDQTFELGWWLVGGHRIPWGGVL